MALYITFLSGVLLGVLAGAFVLAMWLFWGWL